MTGGDWGCSSSKWADWSFRSRWGTLVHHEMGGDCMDTTSSEPKTLSEPLVTFDSYTTGRLVNSHQEVCTVGWQ